MEERQLLSKNIPEDWKNWIYEKVMQQIMETIGTLISKNVIKFFRVCLESLICSHVDINNMQFGFMPGHSSTDVINILWQMQETPYWEEENLLRFCWPGKDIWLDTLFRTLVDNDEVQNWWMDCYASESYVQWCKLKSKGKWLIQGEVWINCQRTSRFCQ